MNLQIFLNWLLNLQQSYQLRSSRLKLPPIPSTSHCSNNIVGQCGVTLKIHTQILRLQMIITNLLETWFYKDKRKLKKNSILIILKIKYVSFFGNFGSLVRILHSFVISFPLRAHYCLTWVDPKLKTLSS